MIEAVIFDMDGVLADSEPIICEAAMIMFREKGLEVKAEDFLPFVGAGENRYIGGVAEKYDFEIDITEAKARTYEIYLALVPDKLNSFEGASSFVMQCRKAGYETAVASSADRIKVQANLAKIGLPEASWSCVISAEDVEHRKPAPDIFLTAAAAMDVAPESCLVIEDAINGIEAARAAGMHCFAVASSFPQEKLEGADRVFAGIKNISVEDVRF